MAYHDYQPRRRNRGRYRKAKPSFLAEVAVGCVVVFGIVFSGAPQRAYQRATMSVEERQKVESSVYYRNCDAARAAGAAPIYSGSPGYREEMDGDSDGIACEPYY